MAKQSTSPLFKLVANRWRSKSTSPLFKLVATDCRPYTAVLSKSAVQPPRYSREHAAHATVYTQHNSIKQNIQNINGPVNLQSHRSLISNMAASDWEVMETSKKGEQSRIEVLFKYL
jgi:hypothetical protein